jgi:hypothetical protein
VTETVLAGQSDHGLRAIGLAKLLYGFSNNFLARTLLVSRQDKLQQRSVAGSPPMPGIRASRHDMGGNRSL